MRTDSFCIAKVGGLLVNVSHLRRKGDLGPRSGLWLFAAWGSLSALFSTSVFGAEFSSLPVTRPKLSSDGTAVVGGLDRETSLLLKNGEMTAIPLSGSSRLNVSADGQVIVGAVRGRMGSFSALEEEAAYWSNDDELTPLGFISVEVHRRGSYSRDTSDDGSVIVGTSSTVTLDTENDEVNGSVNQAFRWTRQAGMVGLGDLPGGGFESVANAVSGDGSVIVGYGLVDGDGPEAFRWTAETGMVGIGDIPGRPPRSEAVAVSRDGSYVVGVGNLRTFNDSGEAFLWAEPIGMVGLGHLSGHLYSVATGVSEDGSTVIGWSSVQRATDDGTAFIWDRIHGMRSLQEVLINDFGLADRLAGWTLGFAEDVSADGRTIVGTGLNSGIHEGWIVTIPEPSTFVLSIITGLLVIGSRYLRFW